MGTDVKRTRTRAEGACAIARVAPTMVAIMGDRRCPPRLDGRCTLGHSNTAIALRHAAGSALLLGSLLCAAAPARADDIDSLKGQFTFDWHSEPGNQKCKAVDDPLLTLFKSDAYQCDLTVITNTASGEPARICGQKGEGSEYLIFTTEKACEAERETQASNAE